jgi:hypothetical protein
MNVTKQVILRGMYGDGHEAWKSIEKIRRKTKENDGDGHDREKKLGSWRNVWNNSHFFHRLANKIKDDGCEYRIPNKVNAAIYNHKTVLDPGKYFLLADKVRYLDILDSQIPDLIAKMPLEVKDRFNKGKIQFEFFVEPNNTHHLVYRHKNPDGSEGGRLSAFVYLKPNGAEQYISHNSAVIGNGVLEGSVSIMNSIVKGNSRIQNSKLSHVCAFNCTLVNVEAEWLNSYSSDLKGQTKEARIAFKNCKILHSPSVVEGAENLEIIRGEVVNRNYTCKAMLEMKEREMLSQKTWRRGSQMDIFHWDS